MWHLGPLLVPLGAFAVAIVAIVSGVMGQAQKQRILAEQRMAMIARGMSADEIDKLLGGAAADDPMPVRDPLRRLSRSRSTALALISVGLGVTVFGALLSWIVQDHEALVVAAAGLIPAAIGVGFLVDYWLQRRDLGRFGIGAGQ